MKNKINYFNYILLSLTFTGIQDNVKKNTNYSSKT